MFLIFLIGGIVQSFKQLLVLESTLAIESNNEIDWVGFVGRT